MNMLRRIARRYQVWHWRRQYRFLETVDPTALQGFSEKRALEAFRLAAVRSPFYQGLLQEREIDPRRVTDLGSFKKLVPTIDKQDVFADTPLTDLCLDGSLEGVDSVMTSSGFSNGVFSVGVGTEEDTRKAPGVIDATFDHLFKIGDRRTFLVNAVPMGLKIPTSLPTANVSVRSDVALAVLKRVRPYYDQFIVVGNPHFLKKLIEEGEEQGIDWKSLSVNLVMGEDSFPESLRDYLADRIGADLERPTGTSPIVAVMGLAELDLNVFHETADTIRIRRLVERDPKLRRALFGDIDATPLIFQYYPNRTYLEAVPAPDGSQELVFTMLSPDRRISLVRYNSRDAGVLFDYERMCETLSDFGYGDCRPKLHLPLAGVLGRVGRSVSVNGTRLSPAAMRSVLYGDAKTAAAVTGQFWLTPNSTEIRAEIQLRPGVEPAGVCVNRLSDTLGKGVAVELLRFRDYPHAVGVDYERKFRPVA